MLTTPGSIRTLQRKLYHKAKQEPACRFHAMYDKIYRVDILSHAYELVRANKGSPGIDGVSFEAIEGHEGAAAFVAELAEALRSKRYKPDPVKENRVPPVYQPRSVWEVRSLQSADDSGLEEGACFGVKDIGKPCAGKPHARFDEGGLGKTSMARLLRHRQTKGAETDRSGLKKY